MTVTFKSTILDVEGGEKCRLSHTGRPSPHQSLRPGTQSHCPPEVTSLCSFVIFNAAILLPPQIVTAVNCKGISELLKEDQLLQVQTQSPLSSVSGR